MVTTVIVDASVWVSWLIQGDVLHGPSDQWLTEYIARQGRLVEPVILLSEIAGAVSRRMGQPARAPYTST